LRTEGDVTAEVHDCAKTRRVAADKTKEGISKFALIVVTRKPKLTLLELVALRFVF